EAAWRGRRQQRGVDTHRPERRGCTRHGSRCARLLQPRKALVGRRRMKIRLLAVGQKMPAWVTEGFNEYAGRMPPECRIDLVELPLALRTKSRPLERAVREEGERMLGALNGGEHLIALDVRGRTWSTEQLSTELAGWMHDGRDIALAVGGPDGLDDTVLARAERRWSLSPLTLPHPLVRVIVAEQLYRAMSILKNHPYHRG